MDKQTVALSNQIQGGKKWVPPLKRGFSVAEAAYYFGVSKNLIRNLIYRGELPATSFGRRLLIDKAALDSLFDRHTVTRRPPK